jgi:hypothetical protein
MAAGSSNAIRPSKNRKKKRFERLWAAASFISHVAVQQKSNGTMGPNPTLTPKT